MPFNSRLWQPRYQKRIQKYAYRNRKRPSPIERKMLSILEEMGLYYIFQSVINEFIVDFEITNYEIVIETDGVKYHSTEAQLAKDDRRDAILEKMGYLVLRIAGWKLSHPAQVKSEIRTAINERIARSAKPDSGSFDGSEITTDRPMKRQPARQEE